jgi:osmoprotectant transport system permease protein
MSSIIAGIRIAATSTIGIATIAATINAGGLGTVLFDGLRTFSVVKLLWGTVLSMLLCLLVNVILYLLENALRRRFA